MRRRRNMPRNFDLNEAVRSKVPLFVGIIGPSSSGKTFSALRLAAGMQRVSGGDIAVVDTEARRALHYADRFKFRHMPFEAPFAPLDYLAAIQHCVSKGASTIIVDSFSHEWEGTGGVLEMHDAELERLTKGDRSKADRYNMLAWQGPKTAHRKMIQGLLQLNVNLILCLRAKPKLKLERGKDPVELGYQPIMADDLVFELTTTALLLPGAEGVPTWNPTQPGERAVVKLPIQFRETLTRSGPLSEDIGEQLARWAAGDAAPAMRLHFAASWGNKQWAGKPIDEAPAPIVAEYIAALEKAKRALPDGLTELYDGMVAAEFDRVQRDS